MELKRPVILGLQRLETLPQVSCSVRNILHDVRSKPYSFESHLLIAAQDIQRLLNVLDTIIYTRKNMGMAICESLKNLG